jgi:hypothetical protein
MAKLSANTQKFLFSRPGAGRELGFLKTLDFDKTLPPASTRFIAAILDYNF